MLSHIMRIPTMSKDIFSDKLSGTSGLINNIRQFNDAKNDLENVLDVLIDGNIYEKLPLEDKVKHDLFVSYSLTSLFWMYLRMQGINPTSHQVKAEIERVQEYMKKYQRVKDRKTAPRLQKEVAARFIKHGLWDPNEKSLETNKKKKFDDSE